MKLLKENITRYGKVLPGDILRVDAFLNHLVDVKLLERAGREFRKIFKGERVDKILTAESSGIAPAAMTAREFKVPVLFAKKNQAKNMPDKVYTAKIMSYTHGKVYDIVVSKELLTSGDRVLVIDDFLARGEALRGLISIVEQAGATLVGCGILIEKGFQKGGDALREAGIRVESLAIIDSMDESGNIIFRQ